MRAHTLRFVKSRYAASRLAFGVCLGAVGCDDPVGPADAGALDSGAPLDAAVPGGADAAWDAVSSEGSSDAPAMGDAWVAPDEPPVVCDGQCVYVRPGAPAGGSGETWDNALSDMPAAPERGLVYFLAPGSYGARVFDTPARGTDVIEIRRATDRDHGTDVGWMPEYGVGAARWDSPVVFATSYWTFDGGRRDEADWFDGEAYGFRVDNAGEDQNVVIFNERPSVETSYITIRRVFVDAIVGLPEGPVRRYAVDTDRYGKATSVGLRFQRMYVRGSNNVWFLRTTEGALLEYSASELADSNDANHGEVVNLYYSGNNATVRYNRWREEFIGTTGTALVAITDADGLAFYGNEIVGFSVGDGALGFGGRATSHNRVFNNTFVGGVGFNSGTAWGDGTDNEVYNNVWVDCGRVTIEGDHDYNAFSDDDTRGEAHAQVGFSAASFVDVAAGDLHLEDATDPGRSLPTPFDQDRDGRTRGADGSFDRGAFEH